MINKEIQDYIDYLLFLKYDRQLVWSNTTIFYDLSFTSVL